MAVSNVAPPRTFVGQDDHAAGYRRPLNPETVLTASLTASPGDSVTCHETR
jgi:hypothetical protein